MKTWDISIDQLPRETASKRIVCHSLSVISHYNFCRYTKRKHWRKRIHHDFSNIYLYDASFSLKEQKLVDFFHRTWRKAHSYAASMSKKQFYHAVNKRQEIEGCAQYILQHDISAQDIQITLTDTTYAPIVKQILNDTKFHIRFFQFAYKYHHQAFSCLVSILLAAG